jgi:hypothetical protein
VVTAGGFVHGYGSFLRFCPVAYPNQPFRSFRLRQNIYSSKSDSEEDVSAVRIVNSSQGYLVDPLDLDGPSNSILNNIYNKLSDLVVKGDRDAISIAKN